MLDIFRYHQIFIKELGLLKPYSASCHLYTQYQIFKMYSDIDIKN